MTKGHLFLIPAAIWLVGCGEAPKEKTTAASQPAVPVSTATAAIETWPANYEATGTVRARTSAVIAAKLMGYVREVKVQAGDRVREGQPLVMLDTRDLDVSSRRAEAARDEVRTAVPEADGAVAAAKAAVEEGIVAGGGSALIQAGKKLKKLRASLSEDEALGVDVFSTALSAPLYWIASNAGLDGAVVVNKVSDLPAGHGLNAATLTYGDLIAEGVIDPVKVTRSAVLNAASVARMVLSTETAIVDKPANEEDDHGHGHHHH